MKNILALLFTLLLITGTAFAQSNEAKIETLSGDDNEALIQQVGEINNGSIYLGQSSNNDVTIDQHGTDNNARLEFRGDGNEVAAKQDGHDNFMYVNFRGTGPGPSGNGASQSDLYFEQVGEHNKISGGIIGNRNGGVVYQDGTGNLLLGSGGNWDAEGLMIDGNRNHLDVSQAGQDNKGVIDIIGNLNTAELYQHGFGHHGTIVINGSGNTSTIDQSDW